MVSFFEIQYNNQQQRLFGLQLRTNNKKLVVTDYIISKTVNIEIDGDRYTPPVNRFNTIVLTFIPSLDATVKSSLHYDLLDGAGVSLGTGTIEIDIHGSLGIITLHNGSTLDDDHVDTGFGGKIWTNGIQAV